jgi:peptide/nickel transport system permease protein
MAILGLVMVLLVCEAALLAPFIAPFHPNEQLDIVKNRFKAPSTGHLLGTDRYARDVFSRIIYGARISLVVGFLAVLISITVGTAVGAIAGFARGLLDNILMRFVDLLLSIPGLVLLIVLTALFHRSLPLLIWILGLTRWMGTSRIVRSQVLSLMEQEFIIAAKAMGARGWRIISLHLVPNTLAPVIVSATLGIGNVILVEAALSFLGLGVPPPTSTWGMMVNDGRDALLYAWWASTFPGLAIVYTVFAFNLLGDGLRDALDPRMRSA